MASRAIRWLLSSIVGLAVVASSVLSAAAATPGSPRESFIVVLRGSVADSGAAANELSARHNGRLGLVYRHALKGFSVELPPSAIAALQRDPRVAYVERDQVVFAFAKPVREPSPAVPQTTPTGVNRIEADKHPIATIDGLDTRVDADVAIIDTGVASHPDLNVFRTTNCSGGAWFKSSCKDGSAPDGNGHGTHVAGTAAAIDDGTGVVGVAPGARIWAVKVLNDQGSGYMSWIIAGVDWVTSHASSVEVANMSLGCECASAALDDAITRSTDAGIVYVVAAGNSAKDAATFSPANHPQVIAVSAASDSDGKAGAAGGAPTCRTGETDDALATFSNYGETVDLAAPGVCINSTWLSGGFNTISGTSMASPHAAGAAALYIVQNGVASGPTPSTRWSTVREGLQGAGWSVAKDDPCGYSNSRSNEHLLLVATPCDTATP